MKKNLPEISDMKKLNIKRTFHYIYTHSNCTKQSMAADLNLSLPTVSNCLSYLFSRDLIQYSGSADSTGGRKAQYITIHSHLKSAIGISVTLNHLRIIALDLSGNVIGLSIVKYTYTSITKLSELLSEQLETFINVKGIDRNTILGVNITLPALLSPDNKIIDFAPIFQLTNISFSELTKYIPYNSKVSNDASCGGFCELLSNPQSEDLIYLSLDRGVGGAIFFNRELFNGDHNYSAEFGHMCIHPGGKRCKCGKSGCLEAYCSTDVLSDGFDCSLDDFFREVSLHNEPYCDRLDEYLNHLAIAITNISVIFDKRIVIGGGLSCYAGFYSATLNQKVNDMVSIKKATGLFGFSKHGYNSSCTGAALHYITEFIETI